MKKMIKSALALVAAVVLGSSAWAADLDESCDVTMTVGVTSNMLAKLNVADAAMANWVLHSSDKTVATVEWAKDDDNKNVVAITSVANGQAEVVARSPEDVEYTFNVYVSTVEMEKSIKAASETNPNDKSNATIRVVTHVDCGATSKTPQILFIGSLCKNHGLDSEELKDAFDALLDKGDVEYVFFDNPKGNADVVTIKNGNSNTIKKGTETYTLPLLSESTHSNLRAYLTYITNKLDIASANYKQYDYVVLEFDNNRLATNYNLDKNDWTALENRAARCLKKFYEKNLVLWVVDDGKGTSGDNAPFYGDEKLWYTPSTYRKNSDGGEMDVTCVANCAWNGLAALLDPKMYFEKEYGNRYITTADKGGTEYKTLHRIDSQVTYGKEGAIAEAINKYMKFPSFAAEAADKVVTAGGTMSIPEGTDRVTLWNWTGKDAPKADKYMADDTGWEQEKGIDKQPKVNGDQVTCVVSNLNGSTWQKLEIKVRTTPEFMAEAIADAKGDQKFCTPNGDGTFSVNPNNGEATMELSRSLDGKKQGTLATGAAAAANAWIVELPEFEFTVSAVNRPYDGTSTNVTVNVTDKESHEELETSLYKLAYSTDGGTTWTTNTVADFYAAFKDVVDTTVAVKVVITGDDTYKPSDDSQSATLTITPLTVTVTAGNGSKTYGDPTISEVFAADFDVSAAIAIGEGTSVSNELKKGLLERAAGEDAGTYDITNNLSKAYSAGGNYTVIFNKGTFTINKAAINGYDNGTEETKIPAWAWAKPVSIVTNDTPVGGGQLIVVETSLLKESDNPKFTYSVDGGSTWLEEAAARAELKDICYEKKVWCKVECDNYYSTNVWAYVTIKERITEIDKKAAGEWATEGSPKTDKTDDALMAVAKNISKDRTGWITADATLAITDPGGSADGNVTAAKEAFEKRYCPPMTLLDAKPVDVKLMYIETTSAGPQTPEPVDDASKITKPIQFKVAFADTDNLKAVYHCHGEDMREMSKVSSFTSSKDFPGQYKVGDGEVTLQMGQFSTLVFITAEAGGCDHLYCAYAYRVKLAGKTVTGKELTSGKVGGCDYESNCWAKPASFRVAGYIYNASLTEPAECEECECNVFADVQSHFWTADRKQTFANDEVTFDVFDVLRNGGFKNKAQLCVKIGENIKLAGFGAFNPQTRKLKSANGFFAGTLAAPTCGKLGEDCEWGTTPAKVFAPCALEEPIEDGATAAIVYGRWTMTYKADKVRQIEEDDNFNCLYPTGFTYSAVP